MREHLIPIKSNENKVEYKVKYLEGLAEVKTGREEIRHHLLTVCQMPLKSEMRIDNFSVEYL